MFSLLLIKGQSLPQYFVDEDYPDGQGLTHNLEGSYSTQSRPDSSVADCCYEDLWVTGSFCPTQTGQYSVGSTLYKSGGSLINPPYQEFCFVEDNNCIKKEWDGEISRDRYLYQGKCYRYYFHSWAGDATKVKNQFWYQFNGARESSLSFSKYYGNTCMLPKNGSRRLGPDCQSLTTIYCNKRGTVTHGMNISPGNEQCVCTNPDPKDIFCEPPSYLPFAGNSYSLKMSQYETHTNEKFVSNSIVALNSNSLFVPQVPYQKYVYSGYIYLPQAGDYSFRATSKLPVRLEIGTCEGTMEYNNFIKCQRDTVSSTYETHYTTSKPQRIVMFTVTVFTQCSIHSDHEIKIEWINRREAYLKRITPTYGPIPIRYLSAVDQFVDIS